MRTFGQAQTFSAMQNVSPKGRSLANHDVINPLGLYVVYTPLRDSPATFPYCCTTTVLEWESGHDLVLPPVVIPESIIIHVPDLRR